MVRKKMILLLFGALLLSGCGASGGAPAAEEYVALDEAEIEIGSNGSMFGGSPETFPAASADSAETEAPAGKEPAEATDTAISPSYFVFTRNSTISTADDGTELLYEYTCDTAYTSMDPELEAWVESVLDQIRQDYASNSANLLHYAQEYVTSSGAESFYSYSNYQELGVGRHDSKVVSLMVLSSVYSGGAHPNTVQTAWNLDMETRTVLTLEDVIYADGAQTLSQLVLATVEEKFLPLGEGALFGDYADTIFSSFALGAMTPYWYLNDEGLVIFYNQYELGPYAAGIIKAEIPYSALNGILREEYFPGSYSELPGDLLLRGDWEGYRKIPITVEPEGDHILIGVEGEVYQVQLSEVSWLEGTAIGQKMLFSASSMTQNDVIELIGGYDDESRSFAIEFTDGQGNTTVYYVHPEGLSEAP